MSTLYEDYEDEKVEKHEAGPIAWVVFWVLNMAFTVLLVASLKWVGLL